MKFSEIDGFFVVCAHREDTGLPYDILLDSLGTHKTERVNDVPWVGVIICDTVVPISISERPLILSEYGLKHKELIIEWVSKRRELLLKHWNGQITDKEILEALRRDA